MKLIKAFGTANMPEQLFKKLLDREMIIVDGVSSYALGTRWTTIEQENQFYIELDEYFIKHGAEPEETILIAHGENW